MNFKNSTKVQSRSSSLNKKTNETTGKTKMKKKKAIKLKNLEQTGTKIKYGKLNKANSLDIGQMNINKKQSEHKKEVIPEIKICKNIDTLGRLINNSTEILISQDHILKKWEELTKNFAGTDIEVEKLLYKNEHDDFTILLEKYGRELKYVMNRLKSHSDEVHEVKGLKLFILRNKRNEQKFKI
jgi:hypothetical protein